MAKSKRARKKRGPSRALLCGTAVVYPAGMRKLLGISEPTLWRWERNGKIPARDHEVGGRGCWKLATAEAIVGGPITLSAA